jgi:hypothetical protein
LLKCICFLRLLCVSCQKKNKNESVTRLFLLVLFLTKQNSKNKKKNKNRKLAFYPTAGFFSALSVVDLLFSNWESMCCC